MRKKVVLSIGILSMLLLVTAAYNPASATTYAVGVKVGDTADYDLSISVYADVGKMHIYVYGIVGTEVTLNVTLSYPNGTEATSYQDDGDIANNPGVLWLYLIAKNLTTNDPLWVGSTVKFNETETMTVAGASRTVGHLNHTFAFGFTTYSGNIWWDRDTGITVKTILHLSISWPIFLSYWFNATITSTSLWSPGLFGLSYTELLLIGAGAIVFIAVVVVLLRRRK